MADAREDLGEQLTHIKASGELHMVDVAEKPATERVARARAEVRARAETVEAIRRNALKKGDVVAVAKVAGIMAAKRTSELIPLCHPIALTSVDVQIEVDSDSEIVVNASARTVGPTGVEMEALTAATIAALTIYDMCKAMDRGMTIVNVRLEEKSGGKTGVWTRSELES